MKDKKWIITGLILFIGVFTFPLWYNIGHQSPSPDIVLSDKAKASGGCILPADQMRSKHMRILDDWREIVVRQSERTYKAENGKEYLMSLSNTCLDCHHNKEEFCDRCHSYASVRTYCWECHVNPSKSWKEAVQ